ncbi:cyclic nucleotide-binding domain-containing protein [Legionella saoudiensis]|uniref:cyclic nucleotide-binding domain-containing protein n=1 Tax=Legionella saoudiensis TaxID=1750561 RepID=UPI000730F5D4|nr:cyclic nucleotide-binding domain-containing protein [Legionella saoudiensis]
MNVVNRYPCIVKEFNPKSYFSSNSPAHNYHININSHKILTEEFTEKELADFYEVLGSRLFFGKGEILFQEYDESDSFYIILEGEAEVFISTNTKHNEKHAHVLATLKENDVIGDMALVENRPRSASIRAKSDLAVLSFNLEALNAHPRIRLLLTKNMAKILSQKLRDTNQVTIKKMEESLEQAQARNVLGVFMIAMFWLISLYTLSLTTLIGIEKNLINNTTFLSVGLIIFFALGILGAMRLTGLPLKQFGITFEDWPEKTIQALKYSLPVMFLFLLAKAYLVYWGANPNHVALFSGFDEGLVNGKFSAPLYLVVVFFYALLVPIQELIARCALQSTFFSFLPGNETFRIWNAIILSNLIFSSVHSHLSLMFASLTFIPGLFWGWLFYKQSSLVSVSASHLLIGVWGIFILGAKGVIY